MSLRNKIKVVNKLLFDKDFRFIFFQNKGLYNSMPDKECLERLYRIRMHKELDLNNPVTYNEKLQWLKLYDRKSIYSDMVDKVLAKEYARERIGSKYIIPTLGVWDDFKSINFDSLPSQFVLKCTHDSGGIVICKDKSKLDIKSARKKIEKSLKRNYFYYCREWPYKNVKPRILAEQYMEDTKDGELRDYKFFTFGGIPKVLYIAQGRGKDESTVADFFDMDFNHLPFTIDHDMANELPHPPDNFEEMKRLAAVLSQGTPQLRVDFYEVDGSLYLGEMTFFHCSGMESFKPEEWDRIFGDWVVLPEKTI